jgi:fermentation-respiration switch protein FrsA (DUF1100 family)
VSVIWAALIALGASTAGTIAYILLGACAIAYLATHPPRRRVRRTPAEFGAPFEEVVFPSRDEVMLSGWFVPANEDAEDAPRGAVILCHGMLANRAEVLPWARPLWEDGFALLMFDFRALGESGGELCTAGYFETQDLHGAVDYLTSRPESVGLPVGVFGFSMGGAAAILAAAEEPRIQAVATHGAYATLDRAIKQRCRHHFGPFAPIVEWITRFVGDKMGWFPASPSLVSPVDAVSRLTPRPLLLLHGGRDRIIRPDDAHALHAAAGDPKALHILPRSGHKRIHRRLRQEARQRVAEFFRATLCPSDTPMTGEVESPRPMSAGLSPMTCHGGTMNAQAK